VAILFALLTVVSTLTGGLFALRYRDHLHLLLGLSAGLILGVFAFDLLPEIFELVETTGVDARWPMVALVGGFLAFHVLEKSVLMHAAHEGEYGDHHHPTVGVASAMALVLHSFGDGAAIGFAFQLDEKVGYVVTLAVIGHDFADGLNTVGLMTRHGNSRRRTMVLLAADALAPVLGASMTLLVVIPNPALLIYLGVFAGVLLYISAADVLPEAHAGHPSRMTIAMTVLGAASMWTIVSLLE
jgi:ZIP family zinc transporter